MVSNILKNPENKEVNQFKLTKYIVNNLQQFNVTPVAKLVLIYLSDCYNSKKTDVFPKQKTIADKLGVSERSVVRAIDELFNEGLILKECKYTNRYKFTSKLINKQPSTEKIFASNVDKMSSDLRQNVSKQSDKLSVPIHEHIKEHKKNISDEDFLILDSYVSKRQNVLNKKAYLQSLLKNGSAFEIVEKIKEDKRKQEQKIQRKNEEAKQKKLKELEEIKNFKDVSEWTEEEAMSFVQALPAMLRTKGHAKFLIDKYNLSV